MNIDLIFLVPEHFHAGTEQANKPSSVLSRLFLGEICGYSTNSVDCSTDSCGQPGDRSEADPLLSPYLALLLVEIARFTPPCGGLVSVALILVREHGPALPGYMILWSSDFPPRFFRNSGQPLWLVS